VLLQFKIKFETIYTADIYWNKFDGFMGDFLVFT